MEAIIKSVISEFIKKDISSIDINTIIDKSAVKSSILVHRMYGTLGNAGIVVNDYLTIRTYGELLGRLNKGEINKELSGQEVIMNSKERKLSKIGIDIENVNRLPSSMDYREDEFYKMNFTASEISYCSLQPNPIRSFAGLFAAKEAIVKASARYNGITFNKIEIDHEVSGKPVIAGFSISISYMDSVVVAVAVQQESLLLNDAEQNSKSALALQSAMIEIRSLKRSMTMYTLFMIISLLAALVAIGLVFSH